MVDSTSAFRCDERWDLDYASNGCSRFEVYLGINAGKFCDYDDRPTLDEAEFAGAAFLVALSPIMSPGYVLTDSRALDVVLHRDDEGRVALAVSLVSVVSSQFFGGMGTVTRGWRREGLGRVRSWVAPEGNDRVVVLPTLTVRVPLSGVALPTPVYTRACPDVAVAKQAVAAVCAELNRTLAPVLAMLDAAGVGA